MRFLLSSEGRQVVPVTVGHLLVYAEASFETRILVFRALMDIILLLNGFQPTPPPPNPGKLRWGLSRKSSKDIIYHEISLVLLFLKD